VEVECKGPPGAQGIVAIWKRLRRADALGAQGFVALRDYLRRADALVADGFLVCRSPVRRADVPAPRVSWHFETVWDRLRPFETAPGPTWCVNCYQLCLIWDLSDTQQFIILNRGRIVSKSQSGSIPEGPPPNCVPRGAEF